MLQGRESFAEPQQPSKLPFLLEHMARNKGATAAATIAGAAAGGAIAGPFGIAAGMQAVYQHAVVYWDRSDVVRSSCWFTSHGRCAAFRSQNRSCNHCHRGSCSW